MSNGVYISAASPESIRALSSAILDVLSAPHADEKTKQIAIYTLREVCKAPSNTSISNCQFGL